MDKYSATWVSHSSISDFLKCPRSYYLRAIYKNPATGRKMTIVKPALALGQAVHEVIESLAVLPADERLKISLVKRLEPVWLKITGKRGGFTSHEIEMEYRERANAMLINLQEDPGPLTEKAIKIKSKMNLPNYWLDEAEGIILCGKIDWLKYVEKDDSVHVIDFKTGKNEEPEDSLQLPIYLLLATNTQSKKVSGVSYWYLDHTSPEASKRRTGIVEKRLPDLKESFEKISKIARRIKLARQINHFKCPKEGCFACRPYERILKGEGELIGVSETKQDIYMLPEI
jgi:ATP-dependent helicase/DNAse subunit B